VLFFSTDGYIDSLKKYRFIDFGVFPQDQSLTLLMKKRHALPMKKGDTI